MQLSDALALAQQLAISQDKHEHYEDNCELAEKYEALVTGDDMEVLLNQFVRREDDEAFEQRVELTIAITPAITSALSKPFNKVLRNNKVKKSYDFNNDSRNNNVKSMRESFFGRRRSKNKGLDYWLSTKYPMLAFTDPNAWVVVEWDTPASPAEIIKPRPFVVDSESAWNWKVFNEEVKWLWAHEEIMVKTISQAKRQSQRNAIDNNEVIEVEGDKFTLYDEDYTIVMREVNALYLKSIGYQPLPNEILWKHEKSGKAFIIATYEPKLGYVPAFRVGWVQNPETDGDTFVNGWHDAMPYLMKSIKTVSEMDLTMALHVFPQKMQYVQPCPGIDKVRCINGKAGDGSLCTACKGSGFKVHTTSQDALYFKLPTDATASDLLDLEKMLVYKTPPIDLIKFQQAYIDSLKVDCMNAVFGQTTSTKVTGTTQNSTAAPITATEVTKNSEGMRDALYPMAEKYSEIWIDMIFTFGRLAGTGENEDVDVKCIFPADLKIKSMDELLTDLKVAMDSGAPSFLIDSINKDIADVLYEGDEIAMKMYEVRHRFYPFNGMASDDIAMLISSQYVSDFTKVLYANFEAIMVDIDMANPDFWFMSYEEQWKLVEATTMEYMDEVKAGEYTPLNIGGDTPPADGKDPNPNDNTEDEGGGDDNGQGGNNGSGSGENQ